MESEGTSGLEFFDDSLLHRRLEGGAMHQMDGIDLEELIFKAEEDCEQMRDKDCSSDASLP